MRESRAPPWSALVGLASAIGLLVAIRAVVALDPPHLAALVSIDPIPSETLGIVWSDRAAWPADLQRRAFGGLVGTIGALGVASALVATLNVLILLVESAASRRRDSAVRIALGAGPWKLVRRLIGELRTLSVAGFALGLLGGLTGGAVARATWPDTTRSVAALPFTDLAFAAAVLLGWVVVAHVGAAWRLARSGRSIDALRSGARVTEESAAIFTRKVLTVVHATVSGTVVLATVALSPTVGARGPSSPEPLDGPVTAESRTSAPAPVVIEALLPPNGSWAAVLGSLRALPGLEAESLAAPGALVGLGVRDIAIAECGACVRGGLPAPLWNALADHHVVAPGFFDFVGIDVVDGRSFQAGDNEAAAPVAIVNRTFARSSFERGEPIGKRIRIGTDFTTWYAIIGIVDDRPVPVLGGDGVAREAVYLSALQRSPRSARILLRGEAPEIEAARAILERGGFSPSAPTSLPLYLDHHARVLRWSRNLAIAISGLVLLLAGHGIYVTALQTTRRRAASLAVRRAVGAPSHRLVAYVLAERLRITAWALCGLVFFGTMTLAFLEAALGVPSPRWTTWSAIAAGLTVLSLVASIRATREAISVEPTRLLQ